MVDVVTFGEAMVRLSPPQFHRLEQTETLDLRVGGAELNVAVGVTRFGLKSAWISKLPRNVLGYLIRNRAQQFGVDCSRIVWSDQGRAGLYFIEFTSLVSASLIVLFGLVSSGLLAILFLFISIHRRTRRMRIRLLKIVRRLQRKAS